MNEQTEECENCHHTIARHDEPGDTEATGSCRDCAAEGLICDLHERIER